MKNSEEMNRAVEMYADMVRRICLVHLKNKHDMEDVFQNVFLKYMLYKGSFENEEHEKAWLVRVTVNACGDWLQPVPQKMDPAGISAGGGRCTGRCLPGGDGGCAATAGKISKSNLSILL